MSRRIEVDSVDAVVALARANGSGVNSGAGVVSTTLPNGTTYFHILAPVGPRR